MKGLISFHPVDLELVDRLLIPLAAGEKVNPDPFLDTAVRLRTNLQQAGCYVRALRTILESAGPPEADPGSGLWTRVRTRLERFDYRPDKVTHCVLHSVEADIHLDGRPFFVAEGSADRVASLVEEYAAAASPAAVENLALEQLVRLHKDLAGKVEPEEGPPLSPDFTYRRDLLAQLKALYDLTAAARLDETWREPDRPPAQAVDVVREELGARVLALHARAVPFWVARDVDGLETIARAAGVEPPGFLVPAWRILGRVGEEFEGVREHLGVELKPGRSVGAFVAPGDIPDMLDWLHTQGGTIIRIAAQHGEGPACESLLRKMRECATYASTRGHAYVEAAGMIPPHLEIEED